MDSIADIIPLLMFLITAYLVYTYTKDHGITKGLFGLVVGAIALIVDGFYLLLATHDISLLLIIIIIVTVCTYLFMKSAFFTEVNGRIYNSQFTRLWLIHSALNTFYLPIVIAYYAYKYRQIKRSDDKTTKR